MNWLFDTVNLFVITMSNYFREIQGWLLSLPTMATNSWMESAWNFSLFIAAIWILVMLTMSIYKWIFWLHWKWETIPAILIKVFLALFFIFWFSWLNDFLAVKLVWTPDSVEIQNKPDSRYVIKTVYPWTALKINNRAVTDYEFSNPSGYTFWSLEWWKTLNWIKKGTLFPLEMMTLHNSVFDVPIPTDETWEYYCKKGTIVQDWDCVDSKGDVKSDMKIKATDVTSLSDVYTKQVIQKAQENASPAWFPIKVIQTLPQGNNWKERYSYAMIGSYYDELLNDSCLKDFPIPKEILREINLLDPFNIEQTQKVQNEKRMNQILTTWQNLTSTRVKETCYPNEIRLKTLFAAKNIVDAFDWKIYKNDGDPDNKETVIDENSFAAKPTDPNGETTCFKWNSMKQECAEQYNSCKMILAGQISWTTMKWCLQNDILDTTNALTVDTTKKFSIDWNKTDTSNITGFVIPVPKGVDWWFVTEWKKTFSFFSWKTLIIWVWIIVWVVAAFYFPFAAVWISGIIAKLAVWTWVMLTVSATTIWVMSAIGSFFSSTFWVYEYKKLNREPYLASVYSFDLDWNWNSANVKYENEVISWNKVTDKFETLTFDINEFNNWQLNLYNIHSACAEILKWISKDTLLSDYLDSSDKAQNLVWNDIWKNAGYSDAESAKSKSLSQLCPSLSKYTYKPVDKSELNYFSRDLYPYEINYIVNPLYNPPLTYSSPSDYSYSDWWDWAWDLFDTYLSDYLKGYEYKNNTYSNNWTKWLFSNWYKCLRNIWENNTTTAKERDYNCVIWDFNRLTDVRINPFRQNFMSLPDIVWKSWLFNEYTTSTHVSIPIISYDWQPHTFTTDRRHMWFANEAKPLASSLTSTVEWLKITEWDVFSVKPWSIIWSYAHPYKVIYDERLEPYVSVVELTTMKEIPNPDTNTKIYTNWLYYSLFWALKDWTKGNTIDVEKELKDSWTEGPQKSIDVLNSYIDNLYTSRADQLKQQEGTVVDWLFDPFYWFWYTNMSNALFIWQNFFSIWRFIFIISWLLILITYAIAKIRFILLYWMVVLSPIIFIYLFLSNNQKSLVRLSKFFQLYISLILFSFFFLIWITLARLYLWIEYSSFLIPYRDFNYSVWISLILLASLLPSLWLTKKIWDSNIIGSKIELAFNATGSRINEMWAVWANQDYMKGYEKMQQNSKDQWPTKVQKIWADAKDKMSHITDSSNAWKSIQSLWTTSKDLNPKNVYEKSKEWYEKTKDTMSNVYDWTKNVLWDLLSNRLLEKLWMNKDRFASLENEIMDADWKIDDNKIRNFYDALNSINSEEENLKDLNAEDIFKMTPEERKEFELKLSSIKEKDKFKELKQKELNVLLSKISNQEMKDKILKKINREKVYTYKWKIYSEELLAKENENKNFKTSYDIISSLKKNKQLSSAKIFEIVDELMNNKGFVDKNSENVQYLEEILHNLNYGSLTDKSFSKKIETKDWKYDFNKLEWFAKNVMNIRYWLQNEDLISSYLKNIHVNDINKKAEFDTMFDAYLSVINKKDKKIADELKSIYERTLSWWKISSEEKETFENHIGTILEKVSKDFNQKVNWKTKEYSESMKKIEMNKLLHSLINYSKSIADNSIKETWFGTKYFLNDENYPLIVEYLMASKNQDDLALAKIKENIEFLEVTDKERYISVTKQLAQANNYSNDLKNNMINDWNHKEKEMYNLANKELFYYMLKDNESFEKLKESKKEADKEKYIDLKNKMEQFMNLSAIQKNELLFKYGYNVQATAEQNTAQESMIYQKMAEMKNELIEWKQILLDSYWSKNWEINKLVEWNKFLLRNLESQKEMIVHSERIENIIKKNIYNNQNIDENEKYRMNKLAEQIEKDKRNNILKWTDYQP